MCTDAGVAHSFFVPYVLCLTEETASMVCPTEKVANIIGVSAGLIGGQRALVRGYIHVGKDCALALRGRALRSILAVFLARVQGRFLGPCTSGTRPRESCPQGHGSHNSVQALWFLDKHASRQALVRTTPHPPPPPHTPLPLYLAPLLSARRETRQESRQGW